MSNFFQDIHIARLKEGYDRLGHEIVTERVPLTAEYAVTPEPVPYDKRMDLAYQPIQCGEKWGEVWDCGWFRVRGRVPKSWKGGCVTLNLDFTGEALVFDEEGCPLVSLTTGSVFDAAYSKDMVHLFSACKGGEAIDFWVETGANALSGAEMKRDPKWIEDGSSIHGTYPSSIKKLNICLFDYDKWQLRLDLEVILDLIEILPSGSARRMQVLRLASKALDSLPPERGGAQAVREAMRKIFELGVDPATVNVNGIGHAHIDTAYLWPIRETVRKVARTFASQIGLIKRYPEYKFGASQPQLYDFCKQHYPKLYAKVKKAIAEGRWEVQGGMWVEADCNIPSGESLVRQLLVGRNFFRDEFGVEVKNVWLPDVFGYSGNLPQIMRSAGVDYFLTQKISWNRYNKFPHNTFVWQGIDGSEVLAHFPPEDNYNSQVRPSRLKKNETNNSEAGLISDAICLFGIGDGGGGPKEEHIERGLRCQNLNGCPKFNFAFAQPVLERMNESRSELATWVGELYFEMHRATLTSQASTKLWNRRAEEALRAAEMLCSAASIQDYPVAEFNRMWKQLLCGQFHDIIPGSSINRVYVENVPMLQKIVEDCKKLQSTAAAKILQAEKNVVTYFNPSSTSYSGIVVLPEGWKSGSVKGEKLGVQREADDYVAWVEIPGQSFVTVDLSKTESAGAVTSDVEQTCVLENTEVRYVLDAQLHVLSCFDKTLGIEMIQSGKPANVISLYDDHPSTYDAWDYEEYLDGMKTADVQVISTEKIVGEVRSGVMACLKLGESTFMQTAWLGKCGKRLDFVTYVDWRENHKMARVEFPVTVRSQEARFEIQYGTIARATHNNTKWQAAQFEVVGHRYADLSEPDFGFALLNNSKYGYRVKEGVMSLSLLRSPTWPDPVCDLGQHHIVYSILPHEGALASNDEVVTNAAMINQGLEAFVEMKATDESRIPVSFSGAGVELSVIKKAEKEDCLVVRLVERRGCRAKGVLTSVLKNGKFVACQSSEWTHLGEPIASPATISFKPFEIKTFKVTSR